jgi:hypothetical protein
VDASEPTGDRRSRSPRRGRKGQRLIASGERAQHRDLDDQEQREDAWLAEMATGLEHHTRIKHLPAYTG